MPKWGLTMREGLISRWLKQEGDAVAQGEPVLEVETEKMTNLVEAPAAGVLARILFPAGSTVAVTRPIARRERAESGRRRRHERRRARN